MAIDEISGRAVWAGRLVPYWGELIQSRKSYVACGNLPSGKLTVYYGKSPFLMGKLTINGNFQ